MSKVIDGVTYYTVRFLNYEGTDLLGTCDVPAGGDATPLAPQPETIAGMTFVGWNVDITNVQEDMTVRPVYQGAVTYYTVNFLNYAGTDFLSSQRVEQGGSATAPMPETIKGLTFTGWDTDFTNVQSDLTVRPLYAAQTFTVRFLNAEGTDVWSVQAVAYGGDADPPVPEKIPGSIFFGWSAGFRNVTADLTIRPVYHIIPPHPVLNFYRKNADNTSGDLIKSYAGVNACTISRKLNGECTIGIKLLTRQTEGYVTVNSRLELDGLVFNITEIKKNISGGMCYTEMNGEHISYILNDEEYKVEAFDMTGTPREILAVLLSGTPFTVGPVDSETPVTLRVNREATRRACVMQLIALVECEIEYYGYTIGIRSHVGSTSAIDIMKAATVQDISFSYNVSQGTTNYSLSLYQKGALELGDELALDFAPLGIDTASRIVGMEWNPFNYKEVSITVGDYIPTLNDSLYELISTVEDIRETTAKYTVEFGELIGNGTFYFTRAYRDRPYYHIQTSDGSAGTVTLNKKDGSAFGSYVGATLSGVHSNTTTLVVFYCTVPDETKS